MNVLYGSWDDNIGAALGRWFAKVTNKPCVGTYSAIGWLDETKLRTVVIFSNHNNYNVDAHVYGKTTRQVIKQTLYYVFEVLKCGRLTAMPHRSNKNLLQLLPRLGFVYECTLKNYYGPSKGDDAIVFYMTSKHANKWINNAKSR